jgi:hypothetical protein
MDSKLKYLRYEERIIPGKKRPKKIPMVFLIPGHDFEGYVCRAGPGLRPIPKEGKWYEYTVYLAKRLRCGDAVEGVPPEGKPEKLKIVFEEKQPKKEKAKTKKEN